MAETFFKIAYALFVASIVALGLLLVVTAMPIAGLTVKIVESGSMEPAIKTGSIVVIREADDYNKGDVITFFFTAREETPTTHRIVEVRTDGTYFTKGDANENVDPAEIDGDNIIGKVLFSIPYVGYILDFAKKPLGFALIIGIPAALVIFDEAGKIYGEIRRTLKEEKKSSETDNNA